MGKFWKLANTAFGMAASGLAAAGFFGVDVALIRGIDINWPIAWTIMGALFILFTLLLLVYEALQNRPEARLPSMLDEANSLIALIKSKEYGTGEEITPDNRLFEFMRVMKKEFKVFSPTSVDRFEWLIFFYKLTPSIRVGDLREARLAKKQAEKLTKERLERKKSGAESK